MMNRFNLFLLTFLFTSTLFAQTVDVKHIALNLEFDFIKRNIIGVAEITLAPINTGNKINLDAGMLNIKNVSIANKSLHFNYDGGDKKDGLAITLDRAYTPNETIILHINYQTNYVNESDPNNCSGSFGKGIRFLNPTTTTPNKKQQIWSSGEPDYNKYWFPCHEEISDQHTTEIKAIVKKPLIFLSNGQIIETIENNNNTRTYHYRSSIPCSNYLVSFVVGEYTDVVLHHKKTVIHNFGYTNEVDAVRATTVLLPDMIDFLEEKTGYEYPYPEYSQVVVQDYPFPGLNGQHTLTTISDNYIDDGGVHDDFKYLWDGVALQALASQWFGNLISPEKWNDIWLNNAFAQYLAGQYTIKNNGEAEYLIWYLPFEKGAVLNDWHADYKHPIVPKTIPDLSGFTADNYSKYRGALVLRMLQNEIGDEKWWKAIRLYVKENAYQLVTTKDFQKAIESTTGKSYQWFFDQWIYKTGLPQFEITKNYDTTKKQLTVHVKQTQVNDSMKAVDKIHYFKGKTNIEIAGNIEQVLLEPSDLNTFTFSLQEKPGFVCFDPNENWLCEVKSESSSEEWLQQLEHSTSVLGKQKAMDALVVLAKDSLTSEKTKAQIVDALKREINSKNYWRHQMYAMGSLRKILPMPIDSGTTTLLLNLIKNESSWLKASAISSLGNTLDSGYINIYLDALSDRSDRVINAAAIALGKTKSTIAFDRLLQLDKWPSWKSQSRISALNGLQQLGDARATEYALTCLKDQLSPRWYLATPTWDYPYAAVNTIVALGKSDLAYPLLKDQLIVALKENDINDIFQLVQLINLLKTKEAIEIYILLKERFKADTFVLESVKNYENQFLKNLTP
ncbi:MAG: M1 family aminopeptidase [Bacteroidia bacterium]